MSINASERSYFFKVSDKKEPVSEKLGSVTYAKALTGRLRITIYASGRHGAWASFGVEREILTQVKVGKVCHIGGPTFEDVSLGIGWRSAPLEEKTTLADLDLLKMTVWLAHGELSGQATEEALWAVLWGALKASPDLQKELAAYWPTWIKGLGLLGCL
jgi:hypothetical protein